MQFNLYHISVGDFLRKISAAKALADNEPGLNVKTHEFAEEIHEYLEAGELVPAPILNILLSEAIAEARKNKYSCVLIDGFPRRVDQAQEFEEFDNEVLPEQDAKFCH